MAAIRFGCLTFLLLTLAGDSPKFTEQVLGDKYGYAYGLAAGDLDGDGDLDVTSADTRRDALYWFENDGRGGFTRRFIKEGEPGWFERHALGDINGDGRLDVVVVKNLDGHLVWFENGGQSGAERTWKRHVLTTDLKRAYDVAVADINGDGRLDVAATAWNGNHLAWFANPGRPGDGQPEREWPKEMIDPQLGESRTVRIADFNADGKPDVLAAGRTANLTAWYEKPSAAGASWTKHVIDAVSQQPVHGEPVDLDRDGDIDVVMAHGMLATPETPDSNQVVWYENVGRGGKGTEWRKHVVAPLPYGFEAVAGDLDGDMDLDLVATAWGGAGQAVWFENVRGDQSEWRQHVLKAPWPRANQPILADLDRDGRLDIVISAENGSNEVRWWRSGS